MLRKHSKIRSRLEGARLSKMGGGYPYTARRTPSAPVLSAGVIADTTFGLSWTVPPRGGSAITDYTVQYKPVSTSVWLTFSDGVGTGTTATVTGLVAGTDYHFRVAAVNASGTGAWSNVVAGRTTGGSTSIGLFGRMWGGLWRKLWGPGP